MEINQVALIVCLTLALVLAFNVALYILAKRKQSTLGEFDMLRRAVRRGRDPWGEENAKLEALSRQVAELRNAPADSETTCDQN